MVTLKNGKVELDFSTKRPTTPNGKLFEKKKTINGDVYTIVAYLHDNMFCLYAFGQRDLWEVFNYQDIEAYFGRETLE